MNTDLPLPSGELHVWFVDLNPLALAPGVGEDALSPDERARAEKFVHLRDRRRFVAAHLALRELLGCYLGRPGRELAFAIGPRGKPSLAGPADAWLRFNLSHSQDGALIACARGCEVGVDLEWMRESVDADLIVASTFSPDEQTEWAALPKKARNEAFFAGWVRKEAYVKALGEGLGHPTQAYTVRLESAAPPALLKDALQPGAESRWRLHGIAVPEGFIAAAAAPPPLKLQVRTWVRPQVSAALPAK